jgi:hypothetical protein
MVDVRRTGWWDYPLQCAYGHEWAPGRVIVSWEPCECPAAQAHHMGHRRVSCQAPGCRSVWRDPPHEKALEIGNGVTDLARPRQPPDEH